MSFILRFQMFKRPCCDRFYVLKRSAIVFSLRTLVREFDNSTHSIYIVAGIDVV